MKLRLIKFKDIFWINGIIYSKRSYSNMQDYLLNGCRRIYLAVQESR